MDWQIMVDIHTNMAAVLGPKCAWLVWAVGLLTVVEGMGAWWHGHKPFIRKLIPRLLARLGLDSKPVPQIPITGEVRTVHVHHGVPYEARTVFDKYTREPIATELLGLHGTETLQAAKPPRKTARG